MNLKVFLPRKNLHNLSEILEILHSWFVSECNNLGQLHLAKQIHLPDANKTHMRTFHTIRASPFRVT